MAMDMGREEGASSATEAVYWKARFEDERRKLAMLWKAFVDAEARIAALEGAGPRTTFAEVSRAPPAAPRPPEVVEVVRTLPPTEAGLEPVTRFPVGLYRMAKVPGVTAADVEKLRTFGVNLTDELLHADLDKLAEATGIARERLQRWRDLAELMAISGIGAKWAANLVEAGVTSITQLAALTPEELNQTLMKDHERRGTPEKERLLMERTLPARAKKLVAAARRAAKSL